MIYRTAPSAPFMAEADIANWGSLPVAAAHQFLQLRESTAANVRFFAIRVDADGTHLGLVYRTAVAGSATTVEDLVVASRSLPLRLRVYYNGVTAWALYSQDNGVTWAVIGARAVSSLTLVALTDIWQSADATDTAPGVQYNDYREFSGSAIGPKDVVVDLNTVSTMRFDGSQGADRYYERGEITFTSGKNDDLSQTVKAHTHLRTVTSRGRPYTLSTTPTGVGDPEFFKLTDDFPAKSPPQTTAEIVRWITADGNPTIRIDMLAAYTIDRVEMYAHDNPETTPTPDLRPSSIQFQGSNNDSTWTDIGTVTGANAVQIDPQGYYKVWRYRVSMSPISYRYVRAIVTRDTGSGSIILSEFSVSMVNGIEVITLQYPTPFVPSAGDAISIVPGCDKRITTCANIYNNVAPATGNGFRGFTTIPEPMDPL
jgi:hypothetical protein